jgi:hypothetical protein
MEDADKKKRPVGNDSNSLDKVNQKMKSIED